jgi:hypothetical protein
MINLNKIANNIHFIYLKLIFNGKYKDFKINDNYICYGNYGGIYWTYGKMYTSFTDLLQTKLIKYNQIKPSDTLDMVFFIHDVNMSCNTSKLEIFNTHLNLLNNITNLKKSLSLKLISYIVFIIPICIFVAVQSDNVIKPELQNTVNNLKKILLLYNSDLQDYYNNKINFDELNNKYNSIYV